MEDILDETVEETVETTDETLDSSSEDAGGEDTDVESEETPEETIARLEGENEKLDSTNKQLYNRLKKPKKETQPVTKENKQSDFFEERIELIASGESKEVVTEAAMVAKAKGISLEDAMKEPLITSFKKELVAKKKSEDASLGASGKTISTSDKKFKTGMTSEEHKKAWQEDQKK